MNYQLSIKINKRIWIVFFISVFLYYQIDYKRHFVSNKDNTEVLTIWQRFGNNCYIIPGRYYRFFPPKDNFIKTLNYRNYIGIVWETNDDFTYKISIYNKFEKKNLNPEVQVYSSNDSLLLKYQILDSLNVRYGIRIRNSNEDSLMKVYDYNYIDLNRIFGIKVFNSQTID